MRSAPLASALILVAVSALAAPNAKLLEARRLVDDLELDQAARALDAALQTPGNDRATLLEILEQQGVVWGTLGKGDKARDAFRLLLLLDPDHKLTKAQPPRVKTPFYEAGEWAQKNGPFQLDPDVAKTGDVVDSIAVRVKKDPLALARFVVFHLNVNGKDREEKVKLDKTGRASVKAGSAAVTWWAELLGDREAQLLQFGTAAAPRDERPKKVEIKVADLPPPPPPLVVQPPPPTNTWMRPTGYGVAGAGVVALGVGIFEGFTSQSARDKLTKATRDPQTGAITSMTQREAAAADVTARNDAVIANVMFGCAAGLAATGVVLIILGAPADNAAPAVTVAPAPGGVVISGHF
jgi:hypothetical protein